MSVPANTQALLDVIDDEFSLLQNMVANGDSDAQKARESIGRLISQVMGPVVASRFLIASSPDDDNVLDYGTMLEQSGDALEAEIKSAAIDAEVARQVKFWESKLGAADESL